MNTLNNLLLPLENLIRKYQRYIKYVLIFLSFGILPLVLFPSFVKAIGEQARNVLLIILFLPIFSRVFWLKIASNLMWFRKELGILMWCLAFVHGWGYIFEYPQTILDTSFWWQDGRVSYLWAWFIALSLTVPLILTSNKLAIKKLGRHWKSLHRLAYAIVIFTILHIILISWYKDPSTLWYKNIDILIQLSLLTIYFAGKTLEWKWIHIGWSRGETYPKWQKWLCIPCGYIYDPLIGDTDSGILPGTEFGDIPDNWQCPECGVRKADFVPYDESIEQKSYEARIVEKKLLNPTTLELTIETTEVLESIPWQFITFLWEDNKGKFARQYSIGKQNERQYSFMIKLTKLGRGAKILRETPANTIIHIWGVFGHFHLQKGESPKIFLATGTGLAPIYRMLMTLSSEVRKSLYFSVATESELFYAEELGAIENLDLHIHVTREKVEGYEQRRVDVDTIEANNETEWYLCGNPQMVTEATEKLKTRWFAKIYSEEFS